MQHESTENRNLSASKTIFTIEAQSNGLDGKVSNNFNVSDAISSKTNGIKSVQNGLMNGKATFAERYNSGLEFRNGDLTTRLDNSLRELKIDEVQKNGLESVP